MRRSVGHRTLGGRAAFAATALDTGAEIWMTDGTPEGTVLPEDVIPGPDGLHLRELAATRDRLFFTADRSEWTDLWATDGTPSGARLLAQSPPGGMRRLVSLGETLIFLRPKANGEELWRSDGTAPGTERLATLGESWRGAQPWAMGELAVFFARDLRGEVGLWRTDGTPEGTGIIVPLPCPPRCDYFPAAIAAGAGRLWFLAGDGNGADPGVELWITDGTAEGTRTVAAVRPPPASGGGTYAGSQPLPAAAVLDGRLVFAGHDPAAGIELWRSDGTAAGTGLLADIYPGPRSSEPARMARSGGTVVFVADDGTAGRELWATDGTPEGTRLLRDIRPGPDGIEGKDAWAEDLRAPVEAGGSVWLSADDGANGPELWTSDGTPEGTVLVADLRPGSAGSQPRNLLGLDGFLYLEADDGVHGREPWAVRVELGSDREFRRGDADADGRASIADVVRVLDHLFRHGAAPPCPDAADADDDGRLRVTDAVLEATWLFRGGPAPPFPGPATCGPDPTPDALG